MGRVQKVACESELSKCSLTGKAPCFFNCLEQLARCSDKLSVTDNFSIQAGWFSDKIPLVGS